MTPPALAAWHRIVDERKPDELNQLLADDVVFYSPIVHTPQRGKQITTLYLTAASQVFFNDTFQYVREVASDTDAFLEFTTEIDGIHVNGVDIISWNAEGKVTTFKVMVRPLKAINLIHQMMAKMLEQR